ncbi:MAG: hypothetical protein ACJ8H8_29070 [Geminicoccaceae bacterium]
MASRDHQLQRLYRLRFELGQPKEARCRAIEVKEHNAGQLVVVQRQAKELRQERDRLLAVSLRLYGQPDRKG